MDTINTTSSPIPITDSPMPISTATPSNSPNPSSRSKLIIVLIIIFNVLLLISFIFLYFILGTSHQFPFINESKHSSSTNVEIVSPSKILLPIQPTDNRILKFNLLYTHNLNVQSLRKNGAGIEIISDLTIPHAPFIVNKDTKIFYYYGPDQELQTAILEDLKSGEDIRLFQFITNIKPNRAEYQSVTFLVFIDRSGGKLKETTFK